MTASGVFSFSISDQCPSVLCVENTKVKKSHCKIIIKDFKEFNEEGFLCDLATSNIHHTCEKSHLTLDCFTNSFLSTTDKHTPFEKLWVKNRSDSPLSYHLR